MLIYVELIPSTKLSFKLFVYRLIVQGEKINTTDCDCFLVNTNKTTLACLQKYRIESFRHDAEKRRSDTRKKWRRKNGKTSNLSFVVFFVCVPRSNLFPLLAYYIQMQGNDSHTLCHIRFSLQYYASTYIKCEFVSFRSLLLISHNISHFLISVVKSLPDTTARKRHAHTTANTER